MSITFCICGVEVGRSGTANETPIARRDMLLCRGVFVVFDHGIRRLGARLPQRAGRCLAGDVQCWLRDIRFA